MIWQTAACALALLAALSGCTKVSTSLGNGAGSAHPWTQPGVLRLSDISDPSTLNPMLTGADVAYQLASYTLEYLVQLDDNGNVIPVLCERIPTLENGDISKDGLTVRYHLRKNVTWSDGQPFSARDLVESWKQVMNPRNNVQIREGYDVVAGIEAPDPYTAVVHLKHPYAPLTTRFFAAIQEGPIAVMPAHIIAGQSDLNRAPFNTHPIGTGPFVLRSWERNGRMIFDANPHYWRGVPKLRQIVFQAQPSTATELVRFQTHENDADFDAGAGRMREYRALPGMRMVSSTSLRLVIAVVNTERFPFNDLRVRRALAYAVDRVAILQKVDNGAGILADEFLPHWSWAYTPNVAHYEFDPRKAIAELEEGGYKLGADGFRYRNGRRLAVVIVGTAGSGTTEKIDAILQQNLRAIGCDAVIKTYPYGLIFDISGPIRSGNFNLTVYSYSVNYDPAALNDDGCDQFAPQGANEARYCDPQVDRLERQALVINDHSQRKTMYEEIQRRKMDTLPSLPICWLNRVGVMNEDLHGYTPSRGIIPQWNAWQWSLP